MFNASTVMHHNVYVFYMSLLFFTFVNLRSLIKLKVERFQCFQLMHLFELKLVLYIL